MLEGGGTFYRGTSWEQDGRFSNKDKKLMKQIKFPPEFSQKVDISKRGI
jgi:serine/arginine repetitive matrix protein 1